MPGSVKGFPYKATVIGDQTEIRVYGADKIPYAVTVVNRFGGDASSLPQTGDAFLSGDPEFDKVIAVTGDDVAVRTMLTFPARQALLRIFRHYRARISNGVIWVDVPSDHIIGATAESILDTLGEIADRFSSSHRARPDAVLLDIVKNDPYPGVRLHCLKRICISFPESALYGEAIRAAISDHDHRIRLHAAINTDDGKRIRSLAVGSHIVDSVRMEALTHILSHFKKAEIIDVLESLLRDDRPSMRSYAVIHLWRMGHQDSMEKIVALIEGTDAETAATIGAMLENTEHPETEQLFLRLMTRQEEPIKERSVRNLARIGTVASMGPLKALVKDPRIGRSVRAMAREAMERIRRRVPGKGVGLLSLSDTEDQEGRLSLASSPGRLSVTSDDDGEKES